MDVLLLLLNFWSSCHCVSCVPALCWLFLCACLRCVAVHVHVQAVIGNYAVPILEDKSVWGTNDDSRTAYMDTQVRVCLCPRTSPCGSDMQLIEETGNISESRLCWQLTPRPRHCQHTWVAASQARVT